MGAIKDIEKANTRILSHPNFVKAEIEYPENIISKVELGVPIGKLTPIKYAGYIKSCDSSGKIRTRYYYWFRCECKNIKLICLYDVTHGRTLSCGCHHRQQSSNTRSLTNIRDYTKHGLTHDRLYHIYRGMIDRCYKEDCHSYHNYGGRGIIICDEWKNPDNYQGLYNFINWAYENGYSDNLSIDRIDNDGIYCPENCRWVNKKVQSNNRSTNKLITIGGDIKYTYTLTEWSRIANVSQDTIASRLSLDWKPFDAIFTPPHCPKGTNIPSIINIPEDLISSNRYRNQKRLKNNKLVDIH